MKIKLLKKLRNRFQLHERNGKYRVVDRHEFHSNDEVLFQLKLLEALTNRRVFILKEARIQYSIPKAVLT